MNNLTTHERLKNIVEQFMLFPVRVCHRHRSRANRKARIEALEAVRHTLERASEMSAENIRTVFNIGMYLLLLDQDIAFFTDDLVYAIGDRRRAFLAKHEAILLYEAAEDLPQLLGREFRKAVKKLGASEEQISRLNAVSSGLNRFRSNHQTFLGNIRNVLAAHRDHDALQYGYALERLKPIEVMARADELSQWLNQLVKIITELYFLTVEPVAIISDILVSRKKEES